MGRVWRSYYHIINIFNVNLKKDTGTYLFESPFSLIADKYPIPGLVLITELICRGYKISEAIDWSVVGMNRTILASDDEKVKIMKNFKAKMGKKIKINKKYYDRYYIIKEFTENFYSIEISAVFFKA